MFERELAEIERLVKDERYEKAYGMAREEIFSKHGEHFSDEYREAWTKAKELTSLPIELKNGEIERATMVNSLVDAEEMGDKVFHLSVGCGFDVFHFLVAGRTEQDALDAYADNGAVSSLTLQTDDTMDEDDCISLGNASEPHYFEGLHLAEVTPGPDGTYRARPRPSPTI